MAATCSVPKPDSWLVVSDANCWVFKAWIASVPMPTNWLLDSEASCAVLSAAA